MNYKHYIAFVAVIGCVFAGEADVKDLTDDDFEAGVAEVHFSQVFLLILFCPL